RAESRDRHPAPYLATCQTLWSLYRPQRLTTCALDAGDDGTVDLHQVTALGDELDGARANAELREHEQLFVVCARRVQVDAADEVTADEHLHNAACGAGCREHTDDASAGVCDRQ